MQVREFERLTDVELHEIFDRLFPAGVTGPDVLAELAPDGWEQSPLVACFHPPVERVFEEQLQMHRRIEALSRARRRSHDSKTPKPPSEPEPTLDRVRASYERKAVKPAEELTELVGLCLWDVFSDNHKVVAADGRVANIGSFRGAGAFLDEYLTRGSERWEEGDYLRFYMGTTGIAGRADLTPVYRMIFRRLQILGASWVYYFPELLLVELGTPADDDEAAGIARLRAKLADANTRARDAALDQPPPAIVSAYRAVYGRDPSGWPPA